MYFVQLLELICEFGIYVLVFIDKCIEFVENVGKLCIYDNFIVYVCYDDCVILFGVIIIVQCSLFFNNIWNLLRVEKVL